MIENYSSDMIYVVSFFGNARSVSYSMIPSKTRLPAPKVTYALGAVYELPGVLQVRDLGFVLSSSDLNCDFMIFNGKSGKYERRSSFSFTAQALRMKEGVLVCTEPYMRQIGI